MDPRDRDIDDDWLECRRALEGSGLDEEEAKVAWLVSRSRTNPRIAVDLGIRLSRVKFVLIRIFRKLGVPDRHALAEKVQGRLAALWKQEERHRSRGSPEPRFVEWPRWPPRRSGTLARNGHSGRFAGVRREPRNG